MWDTSNNSCRISSQEPSCRQKEMILNALVADLSFWGDLQTTASSPSGSEGKIHVTSTEAATATATATTNATISSSITTSTSARSWNSGVNLIEGPTTSATNTPSTMRASSLDNNSNDTNENNNMPIWKTAVDARSGKTYYYDMVSRRTQWEKPAQIREMERQQKQEQRQKDKLFFKEMEQNILMSMKRGQRIPCSKLVPLPSLEDSAIVATTAPETAVHRARTLSGMDEVLMQQFSLAAPVKQPQVNLPHNSRPRDAHGRPPLNPVSAARASSDATSVASCSLPSSTSPSPLLVDSESSLEFSPEPVDRHPLTREDSSELELRGVALLDGPVETDDALCDAVVGSNTSNQQQIQHARRNTGGTIYMRSTMMNPDIKATIKCVCGVYRAHILQASSKRSAKSPVSVALTPNESLANVFLDQRPDTDVPSLDDVMCFYQDFYVRSQMEHDTIIMSLIYVERLIKEDTNISPLPENWRSVLFSCMVLASKVWDDLSMWNIDFSNVCGRGGGLAAYTLPRINALELALLKALNFNVKVPASEYAKYYFLIRSMLLKSGLVKPDGKLVNCPPNLDKGTHRSSKSMDDYGFVLLDQTVCLEQLLSRTKY